MSNVTPVNTPKVAKGLLSNIYNIPLYNMISRTKLKCYSCVKFKFDKNNFSMVVKLYISYSWLFFFL